MGVSGSGKTTIGKRLADQLGWPYFEADDFHSEANKEKMGRGTPLTDEDRVPWLGAIRAKIDECIAQRRSAVFTCSGLKEEYRRILMDGAPAVTLVYLAGDYETILKRVSQRKDHYMKADMVKSQFEALEPPTDAITVDITRPAEESVAKIRQACGI